MSRAFESQRYKSGEVVTSFCVRLSLEIMSAIYDLPAVERRRQTTGGPSSRLEKKPTMNSWTRHALCDSVLSYGRNRWNFEHVKRNSMGNETWSIYYDKYFEIWIFYT